MKSNTKLSRNCLKMLLCLVFLVMPFLSFSQTFIPMPIYYGEGVVFGVCFHFDLVSPAFGRKRSGF